MSAWQRFVDDKEWGRLEDFIKHASQDERAEILAVLQGRVPIIERSNGIEREAVHALPTEVPDDLAGAAEILLNGELEALASGDRHLTSYSVQWGEVSVMVQNVCAKLVTLPEVTEGAVHLSRGHHANEATELVTHISGILKAVLYPGEADDEEPDDLGHAVQEHVATAVTFAFAAGRHFQLALGKEYEPAALRGEKVLRSARDGAALVNSGHAAQRARRFSRMSELVRVHSVSNATRICEREGLGDAKAIRSQWYRHKN